MTTAATELPIYADASALVKLVVEEPESSALRATLDSGAPLLATCEIAVVEVARAVRVAGLGGEGVRRARREIDKAILVEVDGDLLETAIPWTSASVRSLDAIHLASALRVGARQILVYDRRLAEAAAAAGLEVLSPGA